MEEGQVTANSGLLKDRLLERPDVQPLALPGSNVVT
jgi:hypothetical protein